MYTQLKDVTVRNLEEKLKNTYKIINQKNKEIEQLKKSEMERFS